MTLEEAFDVIRVSCEKEGFRALKGKDKTPSVVRITTQFGSVVSSVVITDSHLEDTEERLASEVKEACLASIDEPEIRAEGLRLRATRDGD